MDLARDVLDLFFACEIKKASRVKLKAFADAGRVQNYATQASPYLEVRDSNACLMMWFICGIINPNTLEHMF